MTIKIRAMTSRDFPQILEVARTLATWFRPLDQMALAIDLREHEGLIALQEGRMVGFLSYHLIDERSGELSWLGVLPELQTQGIGGQLLDRLEQLLARQGIRYLQLSTVPADHDPAFAATNAFYQRRGFQICRRDEDFYAYGRPRILLQKCLQPLREDG